MDIAQLGVVSAAAEAHEMPLLNPFTGDETGATLLVLGHDSEAVEKAAREAMRDLSKKKNVDNMDALEQRRRAIIEASVVGWRDFVWNGGKPEFSVALLREVLDDPRGFDWIADQAYRFGADRGNFKPASSSD